MFRRLTRLRTLLGVTPLEDRTVPTAIPLIGPNGGEWAKVDTLTIATRTNQTVATGVQSNVVLDAGTTYLAVASGTARIANDATGFTDAEYIRYNKSSGPQDWSSPGFPANNHGVRLEGVADADTEGNFWGTYQSDHVYVKELLGQGTTVTGYYSDIPGYYSDNSGTLQVDIYAEVPNEATPRVVFAVNGTINTSDDVAVVSPGRDTLPVAVTLVAPGATEPQHIQIRLDTSKSQIWYDGSPVFGEGLDLQLEDGETATFSLVALAWSSEQRDIGLGAVLAAQAGQPVVGGAKVTNLPPLFTDPKTGPNPERDKARAMQGNLNDCWFVSNAIALAKQRPAAIQAMVKDNGDATFTVTFPGAPKQPVTVKGAAIDLATHGTSDGIWLAVLEEAYAQLKNDGRPAVIKQFFNSTVSRLDSL